MPFNAALIISIVALVLAISVWFRTKRMGPVVAVMVGAFVLMAMTDTSLITRGGNLVGDAVDWAADTAFKF